jgi:CHAD domain-containing protein
MPIKPSGCNSVSIGWAMAYRFKLDESVRKGFRRIACEQIDLALGELGVEAASAKAIHESRKALKRLRALIRSCAPALGTKTAHRHNAKIRDIARLLSSRRDADVAIETIGKLEERFGAAGEEAMRPVRSHVAALIPEAATPFDARARDAIRTMLIAERKQLGKAQFKGRGVDRLMDGVEVSYRKGRTALKAAYKAPSDLHELRKTVQTHWRQMALLSRAWPEEFAARVAAARELSQLLGDDHDIALLKHRAVDLAGAERDAVCRMCEERQTELRQAAQFRAERLYAEKPRSFRARVSEVWSTGRRIKPAHVREGDSGAVITNLSEAPSAVRIGSHAPLAAKTPATSPSQRRA